VPSPESLLTFALAGVVPVLIPGPSVLFIVARALAHGRRAALASVAGNTVGVAVLVVLVAVGLGAVAAESIAVFTGLKLVGAAYLIYLGIHTYRTRGELLGALTPVAGTGGRLFRQGVVVGVTNPKALVFLAAMLPQFVDVHAGRVDTQILVLGLLFVLCAAGLDSLWGLAAGTARDWFATSPQRLRRLGGAGGITMIVMGAGLAFTGRKD
jgi:threonine/homoserine/homoserine lactone efflux protein